ncbi:glycine zipper 2TM domain-containing protein [Polaromonas jejuensis]|uniref:Glycine zipper 2TM domain-containing protein n=1 Tax=Polaromonas jejuensis TaxID=457502 RepID=A0ABW0Q3N0_9BURK|nr:glycine zipper 2TM domain-containing protein [Polaromonas jejuensis]
MRNIRFLKAMTATAVLAALSACANYPGMAPTYPATTTYPVAPAPATVQFGQVTNVELVRTQQQPSTGIGAGAVVGGVVGGVVGHQVGRGTGRDIATVVGVLGGALVGNAIEKGRTPPTVTEIYRVTVQQDDGMVRTFDYATQPNVRIGDRVRVENNQLYR